MMPCNISKLNFKCKYGVTIKSTKHSRDKNDTQRLFDKLTNLHFQLKHKFPDIMIQTALHQQSFGIILYSKENQRCPIIQFIKKNVTKHSVFHHKDFITDKFHDPLKQLHCVAWSKSVLSLKKPRGFLHTNSYTNKSHHRHTFNYENYQLTWYVHSDSIHAEMQQHWSSKNSSIKIVKSNHD